MRVVDSQTVVQPDEVVTIKDGRKCAGLNLGFVFVEKPEVGISKLMMSQVCISMIGLCC